MTDGVVMLSGADVAALLPIEDAIDAVESAFRRAGLGEIPPPAVLGVHVGGGGFHIKAATMQCSRHYFAAKTNGNFPDNPERNGLPSIQGLLLLADADVGTPLAVMDSAILTELRTAAASAVAARHLSRPDAHTATLVGCGAQARTQLQALATVRTLERVWVLDRDRDRARAFADAMSRELPFPVAVTEELAEALSDSDLCITCTTARRPFLRREMVLPGTFIAAVGADNEEKHEIHPDLMGSATVVVDSLSQGSAIGDLHHALEARVMTRADVAADLGEVVSGRRAVPKDDDRIVVFDSTGTALQDVACAARVYERAIERQLGTMLELATL